MIAGGFTSADTLQRQFSGYLSRVSVGVPIHVVRIVPDRIGNGMRCPQSSHFW
jgi:hypothetical protein